MDKERHDKSRWKEIQQQIVYTKMMQSLKMMERESKRDREN